MSQNKSFSKSLLPEIPPPRPNKKLSWAKSLSARLYGGLILFFSAILLISLFSWKSLLETADIQKILAKKNIPELVLAVDIVQHSERLLKSAPELISSSSKKSLQKAKKEIQKESAILKKRLKGFERSRLSENSLEIRGLISQMADNLSSIEQAVEKHRGLAKKLQDLSDNTHNLSFDLYSALSAEIDKEALKLAGPSKTAASGDLKPAKPISLKDILFYKDLMNLQSQTGASASLLREAMGLSDADLIQPIRERFLASVESCKKLIKALPSSGYQKIKAGVKELKQLGLGTKKREGVFNLKKQILKIEKAQNQYLEKNRQIAGQLSKTIRAIHANIMSSERESEQLFERSLKKNKTALFIINGLSLMACLITAVFFAAPLNRRLIYLSKKMRSLGKGELESKVKVEGNDELAEMAEALEFFRLYALEAQRLNLVEKLMKEVQKNNQKLEETVNNLHKTQSQLVMREKLASLGQLTAGIAHEIKNPLNFIKNFSELSKDLLEDIQREMQKAKAGLKKEERAFIQETMDNLRANMEKISQHGRRANDIITGMLQHSRKSSGKKELVDLNRYMEIYSSLAFHSKRASNPSFNVSFEKDYDKSLQPIEAIPQDISRIILNIISNSCDAIEAKAGREKSYEGCIWLKTRKKENQAEITVKDNGTGLAEEAKEKIFEPFWTTKDTGKGTGLGLSLSHDIALKYGGRLSAESKQGEWTELSLSLPLKPKRLRLF